MPTVNLAKSHDFSTAKTTNFNRFGSIEYGHRYSQLSQAETQLTKKTTQGDLSPLMQGPYMGNYFERKIQKR